MKVLRTSTDEFGSQRRSKSAAIIKFRTMPTSEDPREFANDVNLVDILANHASDYTPSNVIDIAEKRGWKREDKPFEFDESQNPSKPGYVSMTHFPAVLKNALDKVRATAAEKVRGRPGREITAAAAIIEGMERLDNHRMIYDLLSLKRDLGARKFEDRDAEKAVHSFYDALNSLVSNYVVPPNGEIKDRLNVVVDSFTKGRIDTLHADLGIERKYFATLALMAVLSNQECIHEKDRQEFAERIMGFMKIARWQIGMVKAALEICK
jgi:hypothetical protein